MPFSEIKKCWLLNFVALIYTKLQTHIHVSTLRKILNMKTVSHMNLKNAVEHINSQIYGWRVLLYNSDLKKCMYSIVTYNFFYTKMFEIKIIQNLMEIIVCFNHFFEKSCWSMQFQLKNPWIKFDTLLSVMMVWSSSPRHCRLLENS